MPILASPFILYKEKNREPDSLVMQANFFGLLPLLVMAFAGLTVGWRSSVWYPISGMDTLQQGLLFMFVFFLIGLLYYALRYALAPHSITVTPGQITLEYWKKTKQITLPRPMRFTLHRGFWRFGSPWPWSSLHFTDLGGKNSGLLLGIEFWDAYNGLVSWLNRHFNEEDPSVELPKR